MVTRKLTNQGNPLVDGAGNPIVGTKISFSLVDANYLATTAWDTFTSERISTASVDAYTDAYGEFQVPLWPTDRSTTPVFWKCTAPGTDFNVIYGSIPSGTDPYYWYQFASAIALPPPPPSTAAMLYLLDAGGTGKTATIKARYTGPADDGSAIWQFEITGN